MKIVIRVVLALVVLLVIGVVALAVFLPRIVKSDAVRERIQAAADSALGREVRYADLDFALLPPSLVVVSPSVAGATPQDAPLLEADKVALRVALLPLLARAVVVDSLVVDGAAVHLRRTKDGLELPTPPQEAEAEAPAEEEGGAIDLAVRGLRLRGAKIVLEDRAVSPAVTWEVRDLDADARGDSLDEPIAFDVSAVLASGGKLAAAGSAGLDGVIDVKLDLDGVALAPAKPYLGGDLALGGGLLSGRITAAGPAANPSTLTADLEIRDGDVRVQDIALAGALAVEAKLEGGLETPSGTFDIDATGAALRYAESFTKPRGTPATVKGRIVTRPDGTRDIDDVALKIHNLDAKAKVSLGKRTKIVATAPPFDLRGWDELVPALGEYRASGPVEIGELTVQTEPLDVRGTIGLDGVTAQIPDQPPLRVTGGIVAEGGTVRTRDLALVAADQTVHIDATVTDLATTPAYHVKTRTEKADTNQLVSAFTSRRDTFYGLLDFNGDLSGRLGDAPLRSLRGSSALDVRDGRIVGFSLLRTVFGGLGQVGQVGSLLGGLALNTAQIFKPGVFERFYQEQFESITGTFLVANGRASTDDFRMVYREYQADLDGRFGLEDSKYEFALTLTLGQAIEAALAGQVPGEAPASRPQSWPPVGLRGNLSEPFRPLVNPTLNVTPELVAQILSRYVLRGQVPGLAEGRRQIDDAVGVPGTGAAAEELLRGLGGLLGGKQKQQEPPPQQ